MFKFKAWSQTLFRLPSHTPFELTSTIETMAASRQTPPKNGSPPPLLMVKPDAFVALCLHCPGGTRAASAEARHRHSPRRPAAHPEGDHRDPVWRRPA